MEIRHEKLKEFFDRHFYDIGVQQRENLHRILTYGNVNKNHKITLLRDEEKKIKSLYELFNEEIETKEGDDV